MKNFVFLRLAVLLLSTNSSAQCWQQVVSGSNNSGHHTLGIQKDGTLWAWGYNANGQLGDGTTINRLVPTQIGTDTDWVYIAAGSNSSYAIKQNGTLWAWGANEKGQLSDGTTNARLFPTQVLPGTTWSKVSAGEKFVVAQKSDGTLWSCGYNTFNQLGDGSLTDRNVFVQISSETSWMVFNCGTRHTILTQSNLTVWGFGEGDLGKLVTGTDGGYSTPTQLFPDTSWNQAIATMVTSMFKKNDGTIWGVGQNFQGCLGIGNNDAGVYIPQQAGTDSDWKSIESGALHTMALKNNGTLWATGLNNVGQLGIGSTAYNINVFTQVGTAANWAKVRCGRQHTLALDANGTLWAWGKNDVGQLGDGTTTDRLVPTQIGTVCNLSTPEFEKTTVRLLTNPVDDLVQLSFSKDGVKKIELFNSLGVLLATKTVLGDFISFEVSGYASGVYFAKCTMDDIVETVKFVKR